MSDSLSVPWTLEQLEARALTNYQCPRCFGPERYTSQAFCDAEFRDLWPNVWQIVCLESEVAEVGDYVEYQIGDESVLVVRGADGVLRALSNVCRHRCDLHQRGGGQGRRVALPVPRLALRSRWVPSRDRQRLGLPRRRQPACGPPQVRGRDLVRLRVRQPRLRARAPLRVPGPRPRSLCRVHDGERHRQLAVSIVVPCSWKVALAAFPESSTCPGRIRNCRPTRATSTPRSRSWASTESSCTPCDLHPIPPSRSTRRPISRLGWSH